MPDRIASRMIRPDRIDGSMIRVFAAIRKGEDEQERVERALGRALIKKVGGTACSLVSCYEEIGGKDPGVLTMLQGELDNQFQKMPVGPGADAATKAALSADIVVAAGEKSVALEGNSLATLDGQALKTLADLGGQEFRERYKLDRP